MMSVPRIKMLRIKALLLRHIYDGRRDLSKLFDFIYWPLIDIFLMGFMGLWLTSAQEPQLVLMLMSALVVLQVSFRTNIEISKNILQELWDNNMLNLAATPLQLAEWIIALMIMGVLGSFVTIAFGTSMVYLMYGQHILALGPILMLFFILSAMSGWWLGLIGASFLITKGQRVETMVWALGWLSAPFCSIYYPVSVLPAWAQKISAVLPMSYSFEALRELITTGVVSYRLLSISLALNMLYLVITYTLFCFLYRARKKRGLGNL